MVARLPAKAAAMTGEQIFGAQCSACHGAHGEGAVAYPHALTGDKTADQLAKFIAGAMPPGPTHCPPADATRVAAYLYDAFYGPLAQERNRPARVALSRLTVRQYRNAVADLIGSFRGPVPLDGERGLRAEYYPGRDVGGGEPRAARVDPNVDFRFDTSAPSGVTLDPHQFSIRWRGSVIAPDTGVYDFVVKTDHACRLWVNDPRKPLIDRGIKSGRDTEYRASIFLISGRSYPVRLEFMKGSAGVDKGTNQEKPPLPARITLAWKRPHLADEPIPARCLLTASAPESFVPDTPFPPDDRSRGYDRGDSVSKEWDEATVDGALEVANYVAGHLKELAGADDDPAKAHAFCRTFVERALRRPLDPATEKRYVDRQFDHSPNNLETAVKRVILLTLQSPRFLYREAGAGATDPYAVASRLSFTLWDAPPDAALLQAAASRQLSTPEQVERQAERLAADPRAWDKERDFFHLWLKVDQYPDLAKDAKKFPNFTPEVASDLRTSLDLTLENVVRSDSSDFRDLLLSNTVYLNGRLAPLYGAKLPAEAPFQPVSLDPGARAGILTHPYLLSAFGYVATSDPIHRGVLITRNILGRVLKQPPAAFAPTPASAHPDLTTRQRVALQTRPAMCQSCHGIINPLGFTLENFDTLGRLRAAENGHPIDTTGYYLPRSGPEVRFRGATDLARYVAGSSDAHDAFVEKLFQYMVKQPIRAYGAQELPNLTRSFVSDGYNMREMAARIAADSALPRASVSTASDPARTTGASRTL